MQNLDPLLPVVGPTMAPMVRLLRSFAPLEETILVSGPTGAGKSRIAEWVHQVSGRSGPFEAVDLQTTPESTQMGELFGWRQGAFTGAERDHDGFVGRAAGGTLFLDEVDKLSLRAQAGLLQLIETRTYRRLGESERRAADVRFIVGTNVDLLKQVAAGRFRQDLYYRINVLPIMVPALDARRDEIEDWARYMLARRAGQTATFDPAALTVLREAKWPGNLRQLDNVVRRSYAYGCAAGDSKERVRVTVAHVRDALKTEGHASSDAESGDTLTEAARLVAEVALERFERRETTDPRYVQGFWGLVMAAALDQGATVETVFEMFGRERLLESRNHHRTLRREAARAARLLHFVRGIPQGRLVELLS